MGKMVFVLDDDEYIRNLVEKFLVFEGFSVQTFKSGSELLSRLDSLMPDCFVLDIMLPDTNGLDLCRIIRSKSMIPILFISAKGEESDRIIGIEIGGDDYLTKPFSGRELAVRVKSLIRRSVHSETQSTPGSFMLGNLYFDMSSRVVKTENHELKLTTKEYDLFLLLSQNSPKAFSREELLRKIWKWEVIDGTRSVDDLVKRIRKKLSEIGSTAQISTVFGFGYKIIVDTEGVYNEN